MELYENNFGIGTLEWAQLSLHVETRAERFPSVEERVEYYMGNFSLEDFTQSGSLSTDATMDSSFIASGYALSQWADLISSCSEYLRRLCRDALPYFDERITADLKSSSYKRLLEAKQGGMKLASQSCKFRFYQVLISSSIYLWCSNLPFSVDSWNFRQ